MPIKVMRNTLICNSEVDIYWDIEDVPIFFCSSLFLGFVADRLAGVSLRPWGARGTTRPLAGLVRLI